ncbi:shaggy-like protein kinase 32 [Striga asiatica]|uniref:Shaggy-like protein kinase 32 n=1 Tax=Striga asiatica TaxID=4170 RepID=A0A5A7PB73_STRAF|nr:shaggy-like protein kinase 32 [Striga asiatica]
MDSNPTGAVASTSDVHELPMEMNEMKIREDKTDDHEDTTKIFRALNYMLRVIGIFHRDTRLWNLLVCSGYGRFKFSPHQRQLLNTGCKMIEEMSTVARFFNQRDQTLLKL